MRQLIWPLLTAGIILSSGCATPRHFEGTALDNVENVQALIKNNERLHKACAQFLQAQWQALRIRKLNQVAKICDDITASADIAADDRPKAAVEKIQAVLNKRVGTLASANLGLGREEIAVASPVVGDVAKGLMQVDQAASMCLEVRKIIDARMKGATLYALLGDELSEVHYIKSFDEGYQAVTRAYDEYVGTLNRQSELAMAHAKEFVTVSKRRTKFLPLFLGVAKEPKFREGMLDLLSSKKDRARAEQFFEALDTLGENGP